MTNSRFTFLIEGTGSASPVNPFPVNVGGYAPPTAPVIPTGTVTVRPSSSDLMFITTSLFLSE